jgi:histidyl-tRNA synthetase
LDFVKKQLDKMEVKYKVCENLVRGLDYYTDLVFEAKVDGVNGSIGGGGRYSKLVKEIGGPDVSCIGFGLGVERVLNVLEQKNIILDNNFSLDVIVAILIKEFESKALEILTALRYDGFSAVCEFKTLKLSSVFNIAEENKAKFVIILGEKELKENLITIKNQTTLKQEKISDKDLLSYFKANII